MVESADIGNILQFIAFFATTVTTGSVLAFGMERLLSAWKVNESADAGSAGA